MDAGKKKVTPQGKGKNAKKKQAKKAAGQPKQTKTKTTKPKKMLSSPSAGPGTIISKAINKARSNASHFSMTKGGRWKESLVFRGSEYLMSIPTVASPVVGTMLLNLDINPASMLGTRLAKFATLFEKYCFTKLRFKFVPSLPTTQSGTILLAYDRDVMDPTPPATDGGYREYRAMAGARDESVFQDFHIDCPLLAPETGYFTNEVPQTDARLIYQGQLYVVAGQNFPSTSSYTSVGSLEIEYELHVFIPSNDSDPASTLQKGNAPAATVNANYVGAANVDKLLNLITDAAAIVAYNTIPGAKEGYDQFGKRFVQFPPGVYETVTGLWTNGAAGQAVAAPTVGGVVPPDAPQPATAPTKTVLQSISSFVNGGSVSSSAETAKWSAPSGVRFYVDGSGTPATLTGNPQLFFMGQKVSPAALGI